jgi:hypothetical protein
MRLDNGSLDMSLVRVLKQTIEIKQLTLSGIRLNLVREAEEANFRSIIDAIRRLQGEIAKQAGADPASRKRFLIRSVIIRDVVVNVDLLPLGGKLTKLEVPIDLLELNDVGADSSRGENLARVIAKVVRALLEAVLTNSEGVLPPETREALRTVLTEVKPLETIRAIRGSLQERREKRLEERQQLPELRRRPLGPLRQRRLEER